MDDKLEMIRIKAVISLPDIEILITRIYKIIVLSMVFYMGVKCDLLL
jgi:hypothetical protein